MGGQPVYLDDLSTIQEACSQAINALLSALGVDMEQTVYFIKKPTVTYSGTTASFSAGVIWHASYGLIALPAVDGLELGVAGNAYIRITVTDSNNRTFEDGQLRPCLRTVTASVVNSAADYQFSEIEDMMSNLAALIDRANKTEYQTVSVEWANGYSGRVEVKQIYGGYRYHVMASSLNTEWAETGKHVCFGNFLPSVSGMFMTGGDTPSRDNPHYLILGGEGYMLLDGGTETLGPSTAPIDITFDALRYDS